MEQLLPIALAARRQLPPIKRKFRWTHVYVISTFLQLAHDAPVKIGIADNPIKRLRQLQTSSAYPLHLTFAFPLPGREIAQLVEGVAHDVSAPNLMHGEWFNIKPPAALRLVGSSIRAVFLATGAKEASIEFTLRVTGVCDAMCFAARTWPQTFEGIAS